MIVVTVLMYLFRVADSTYKRRLNTLEAKAQAPFFFSANLTITSKLKSLWLCMCKMANEESCSPAMELHSEVFNSFMDGTPGLRSAVHEDTTYINFINVSNTLAEF